MKKLVKIVRERQSVLNDLSEQSGDVVHWWEAGMHPSILFIDEYVALRCLLPPKAAKDNDYCVATFDRLLKQIVTQAASCGVFVILSVAEPSAGEAGVPTMIKSAMSTKVLLRPTITEARLMWDSDKIAALNVNRRFTPGQAWLSSTDGERDIPCNVTFPYMRFRAYKALGRLLNEYYGT